MNYFRSAFVVFVFVCSSALIACSGNVGNTNAGGTNPASAPANSGAANSNSAGSKAAASAENAAYPQEVANEFIKSCQGAGSDEKLCRCLFAKIQDKYSFEEFTVMELKLSAGNPPDEFVQFVGEAKAQCTRER